MEIFRIFRSEWAEMSPDKKLGNSSTPCSTCEEFEKQVQEKHELVLSLVNKGNDIQKELQASQENEIEIKKQLVELLKSNENFVQILTEYEEKLGEAIADRNAVSEENNEARKHLASLELAFTDVHAKYEKSKQVLQANRENEATLWQSINENEQTIIELQHKYDIIKEESINKLNLANNTLLSIQQEHEKELKRYKTKVRKLEIKLEAAENSLKQKTLENEKLNSICEEFITKIDVK